VIGDKCTVMRYCDVVIVWLSLQLSELVTWWLVITLQLNGLVTWWLVITLQLRRLVTWWLVIMLQLSGLVTWWLVIMLQLSGLVRWWLTLQDSVLVTWWLMIYGYFGALGFLWGGTCNVSKDGKISYWGQAVQDAVYYHQRRYRNVQSVVFFTICTGHEAPLWRVEV
jgi:hypothetical protein